ncbi:MAG: hypothetical protein Q8S43_04990, partial [Actinomycetota bacterium]|nr:hypothetical protein [Actinomycetota bacterium]
VSFPMMRRGRHRRHREGYGLFASLLRLCLAVVLLVGALVLGLGGSSYGSPSTHCHPAPAGILKVAPAGVSPLVWYDATQPPPALTNQITQIASHLYPGRSGTMVAYVKNTGTAAGIPSIAIRDLVDSGELSGNLVVAIMYSSSLRPATKYQVAAGTLKDLTASDASFAAPVRLNAYSSCYREIGTWTIQVTMPETAGNEVQGDWCTCSAVFGLTGVTH